MAAEHAAERVELVDDDVAQPEQERRPPIVTREDAHVQHLGIGEHDVRVRADPGPLVGGGVTVVGGSDDLGEQPLTEGPQLIVGECLGREHEQRGVACAGGEWIDDRQLVAERLPRRGPGGDGDVPAGAQRLHRVGLV